MLVFRHMRSGFTSLDKIGFELILNPYEMPHAGSSTLTAFGDAQAKDAWKNPAQKELRDVRRRLAVASVHGTQYIERAKERAASRPQTQRRQRP